MSVITLLVPFMVAIFAPSGDPAEWANIFIGIGIVVIIGTTIFNLTAQVTPREWAKESSTKKSDNGRNILTR